MNENDANCKTDIFRRGVKSDCTSLDMHIGVVVVALTLAKVFGALSTEYSKFLYF